MTQQMGPPIDMTRAAEAMTRGEKPPGVGASRDKPLVGRQQPVEVRYRDPDSGGVLQATIVSQVMSADEKSARDLWAATLSQGVPWEQLPRAAQGRFWMLATVLTQYRDVPQWLSAAVLEDDDLLRALYEEGERHGARYFRGGLGAGAEDEAQPRFRVAAVGPAADGA
jgi:hypothetical protein